MKTGRKQIEVEAEVAETLDEVANKLGNPKRISLHTAALRHSLQRVLRGELAMVNGELQEVTESKAA